MAIKDFIYSQQQSMFGAREIIGFGSSDFYIREIDRNKANDIIIKNHYSKKVFNNSYIHLGCFINNALLGVMQFGHLLNNLSVSSLVNGTQPGEALELNRMWFDDIAKKNTESKALSYAIRYIRSKEKKIKWIQSFADQRCGGFGIVYQAANFSYYGEHTSDFYEIDGEFYHKIMLTNNGKSASKSAKAKKLKENKKDATIHTLRQFRYIYFMKNKYKSLCILKEQPYPKHYKESINQ
jgi:adenine modification enzyme